jgi:hypothetical protein
MVEFAVDTKADNPVVPTEFIAYTVVFWAKTSIMNAVCMVVKKDVGNDTDLLVPPGLLKVPEIPQHSFIPPKLM